MTDFAVLNIELIISPQRLEVKQTERTFCVMFWSGVKCQDNISALKKTGA
jgi:hypothetical protein